MHIALYRKYRPKTFSQVIGQKFVVEALKNQIASGKTGHAFIFTGTRGTGKTSCAKIFAKAVNCLHPINGEPCLECDVCKGIENESIYDVTEMDAASNNSVEDIRDVLNEVNYLPVMAKYRVYIIDEVHMLSPAAFNALLKTLEEPPAHVIFILATTEIHKVPATILSRCQRYDFTKLRIEDIADALLEIASVENINLTPGAAKLIASLSDGAMRDANSILDTCISTGDYITEETVANLVGISKEEDIFSFTDSLIAGDMGTSLQNLLTLTGRSVDMRRLCEELINHFSNLLIANLVGSTPQLLGVSSERFEKLKEQAKTCPQTFISFAINCFTTALDSITKGQNAKIALDIAVYTMCNTQQIPQMVPARPQNVQPVPQIQVASQPAPVRPQPVQPEPVVPQPVPTQSVTTQPEVQEEKTQPKTEVKPVQHTSDKPVEFSYWQDVIDLIADMDLPLYSLLKNSVAYLDDNKVYIKASDGFNDYIRSNKEVNGIIKRAIFNACGRPYNIGGFKNIAHKFRTEGHDSLQDIMALRDKGVQINFKD
ncbi:MAG: DNA polymerase III subunit gamma/tau [Oscillospiraceae bacterium]|nr:DNA polymerase III subunit gamma/tau [Oscillospiraceae bacterium]